MGKNLFVGNLPFSLKENELLKLFSEIGMVSSVKIIRERISSKSMGYGFVEMATEELAMEAIKKLNGYSLQSNSLRVSIEKNQIAAYDRGHSPHFE